MGKRRNRFNKKFSNLASGVYRMKNKYAVSNGILGSTKADNESRYHRVIHPNIYAKVKELAKAEGISDDEAYDRIMYNSTYR